MPNEHQLPKALLLVFSHDIKGNALYGYVILKKAAKSGIKSV
jgi:hypothetical protein